MYKFTHWPKSPTLWLESLTDQSDKEIKVSLFTPWIFVSIKPSPLVYSLIKTPIYPCWLNDQHEHFQLGLKLTKLFLFRGAAPRTRFQLDMLLCTPYLFDLRWKIIVYIVSTLLYTMQCSELNVYSMYSIFIWFRNTKIPMRVVGC